MDVQKQDTTAQADETPQRGSFLEVLAVFTRLGFTSFGGPVAHLGYFRQELVARRKWVDEHTYGDLIALSQFLPGPASSQVAISLGILRAGLGGALAAWLGFTLPSAIAMTLFAYAALRGQDFLHAGWIHGLLIVAVAVVAQAVWGMATRLCPDRTRASFAVIAALILLVWPVAVTQILILVAAGLLGWLLFRHLDFPQSAPVPLTVPRWLSITCWILFFSLLVGLPVLRFSTHYQPLALFDSFYRVGSLVFGGGHVVLPLLQREVVPAGWVTNDQFISGYAVAQAVPGPLFSFSAYLGAISHPTPNGWLGAIIALLAIYLPSFLMLLGILPFWNHLRALRPFQAALRGINAAVVGILLAALYQPIWTSAIHAPLDFALSLVAFALLVFWKLPPWLVVLLSALAGLFLGFL